MRRPPGDDLTTGEPARAARMATVVQAKAVPRPKKVTVRTARDASGEASSSSDEKSTTTLSSVETVTRTHVSPALQAEVLSVPLACCSRMRQSMVRCRHCARSFCSQCATFDIHDFTLPGSHEYEWSCRSCLLTPTVGPTGSPAFGGPPLLCLSPGSTTPVKGTPRADAAARIAELAPATPSGSSSPIGMDASVFSAVLPGFSQLRSPFSAAAKGGKLVVRRTGKGAKRSRATARKTKPKSKKQSKPARPPGKTTRTKDAPSRKRTARTKSPVPTKRPRMTKHCWQDDYINDNGKSRLKRFRCSYCPKRFDQRSNLTAHIRSHTGEKPFVCKVCNRSFSQKSNMTRHLKVHA